MAIETTEQLINQIKVSMGSSRGLLEPEEYSFAASQALNELGWSLPTSDSLQVYWLVQRGKRHSLDILRTVTAHKFKYKDLSLNHRFDHYNALIKDLDEKFAKALEDMLLDVDFAKMFGTYIENGIIYDQYGNDISKILHDNDIDNEGYRYRIL